MSISVDDLISSFSSSHIGQEATELAQLQAQLAETLFNANSFASSSRRGRDYHCPTPTGRAPSSSNYMDAFVGQSRSRSSSISGRMEDVEDELMVEELLMGQPSSSSGFENQNSYSSFSSSNGFAQSSYHPSQSAASQGLPSSPSQSLFASTDPFFMQAQANSQSYFYNNSNITQHGRPAQSSPFVQSASGFGHGYHNHFQPATAAAF
ncbi:hypothetical protein BKA70DRAFT_1316581 [Coprinopsis sp. MPI-PUGE-AT-0042]|nr:hypothetical protein BKA70DRAFT_1316581 [Coprinopsis sp. MPI-PUGE-AT-0042]